MDDSLWMFISAFVRSIHDRSDPFHVLYTSTQLNKKDLDKSRLDFSLFASKQSATDSLISSIFAEDFHDSLSRKHSRSILHCEKSGVRKLRSEMIEME